MTYDSISQFFETQGLNLLRGVLVLAVGFFAVHWIIKLITRNEKYVHIEPTLKSFLSNLMRLVLYAIVILTAANVIGVPLTSIITLLASASVAVSLAMQGALSNLVGGVMLLMLKPIKVDEYVKAGDFEGTVQSIGAFYTEFATPDNRHISMPNSTLTNTAIINYTRLGTRRLDVTFSVSYSTDLALAQRTLLDVAERCEGVLPDPEPVARLSECADSGLKIVVRLWCPNTKYWNINYFMLEEGKRALDAAGIEIPYPQLDVHMR